MPTHIITVKDRFTGEHYKLEYTDTVNFDDKLIDFVKDIYKDTLVAIHKVKYEAVLTQVF